MPSDRGQIPSGSCENNDMARYCGVNDSVEADFNIAVNIWFEGEGHGGNPLTIALYSMLQRHLFMDCTETSFPVPPACGTD
jgi:hypothetical protein